VQAHVYPPRTGVEETVLDLAHAAKTLDDVCGWVTRAFARELTDETRLCAAMETRTRLRWRKDLRELIEAAATGDHSVLEFRYHRDVERAHGLPEPARQVPFATPDGRRGFRDRVYELYGVIIEVDGRLAHQPEDQWRDKTRDNAAAAAGRQSLRYGWTDVTRQPCATAAGVARVLRRHGWDGWPRRPGSGRPGSGRPGSGRPGPGRPGPGRPRQRPGTRRRRALSTERRTTGAVNRLMRAEPSAARLALMDNGAAVSVRDLRKSYGDVMAVAGIDFEIARGEVFALLGPNGAGKTTTVEILEGFRRRDQGAVSVLGQDPA